MWERNLSFDTLIITRIRKIRQETAKEFFWTRKMKTADIFFKKLKQNFVKRENNDSFTHFSVYFICNSLDISK